MARAPAFGSWLEFEHTEPSSGDDSTDDALARRPRSMWSPRICS